MITYHSDVTEGMCSSLPQLINRKPKHKRKKKKKIFKDLTLLFLAIGKADLLGFIFSNIYPEAYICLFSVNSFSQRLSETRLKSRQCFFAEDSISRFLTKFLMMPWKPGTREIKSMNCNTFWKARLCYNGVSITSGRTFVWNQAFLRLYTAVELPNAFTAFLCWRKTLVAWDHHQSQYLIQSEVTKVSFAAPFLFGLYTNFSAHLKRIMWA